MGGGVGVSSIKSMGDGPGPCTPSALRISGDVEPSDALRTHASSHLLQKSVGEVRDGAQCRDVMYGKLLSQWQPIGNKHAEHSGKVYQW